MVDADAEQRVARTASTMCLECLFEAATMTRLLSIAILSMLTLLPATARAQEEAPAFRAQDDPPVAQEQRPAVLEVIREALSRGDVEALMSASGERLDLTVFGTGELLSRSQARYVVRSLFTTYPPSRVELIETSESDGNWFASAVYWHRSGGTPISVYVRLRPGSEGWELRELRFDRSLAR